MRAPKLLLVSLSVVSATVFLDACTSGGGGGGETDGGVSDAGSDVEPDTSVDAEVDSGTDAGVDSGTDAGVDSGTDTGVDSGTDAGVDSGADAGVDSGTDAGVDSGVDSGTDGGTDGGMTTALYSGAVVDFDVDATNLYLLLPPSTIAKCPHAGCGAGGPATVRATSQAQEIEALDGVVYYAYRNNQRVHWGQVNEDGTGASETIVFLVGGPYTIAFKTFRTDGRYLYGGVKRTGGGQTIYYPIFKPLPGAVPPQHSLAGGPSYEVRDRLVIEYFPGDSLLPESFRSYDQGPGGGPASYPIPATKPAIVTVHSALAVMVDTTGMAYFCPRVGCVDWTWTTTTANAIAMDASYLYFGTDTDVLRCAVAEMVGGTCTPVSVGAVNAPVAQLIVKPGRIYARTTAPAIEAIDLP